MDGSVDQTYVDRVERMLHRWSGVRSESGAFDRNLRPRIDVGKSSDSSVVAIETQNDNKHQDDHASVVVLERPRRLSVLARCQVLVVGAGPSGLSAAIAARRAGADVMLVERYGCFGGVITTVGMETIGWYRYDGCTNDSRGIGSEMERMAARMGGATKFPFNDSECLDADFFKVVADHLIRESGVRPLLHSYVVDVIMSDEKKTIRGVVTESKSGRLALLADRVIDCSGDADVAFMAGAKCRRTPKEDAMGMTTVLNVSGVDKDGFRAYTEAKPARYSDWSRTWDQETTGKEDGLRSPYLDLEFEEARRAGTIPVKETQNLGGSWSALSEAGEATNLNLAHVQGLDCLDVEDLTAAEMEGRSQAMHALTALKTVVPGFEKAKLRNFGMTIGVRDSRKIVGAYNLTADDVKEQARFGQASIGIFPEFIDGYNILILPTTGRYFEVPYGCLQPVGVENLLVAGRCVAGDMTSHAAMRNMMACTVTGQGAGVAAAVSVREGQTTTEVDADKVQLELTRQGVRIH